ncbi:MAG: glutathione S-transferase N-terminal domain-containing protein, partial [Litorimonas sp.]
MLTLYWGSGSPFAWRVMLALAVKKMDYEGKLISFSSGELSTPEYLAMSPRGQVPLITDGNYSLTESLAIMQYLEARDSSVPIFGKTAQETGDIWRSIQLSAGYIEKPVFDVAKTIFKGQLDELRDTVVEARKL